MKDLEEIGIPVEGEGAAPWNPSTDVVVINNTPAFTVLEKKKTAKSDPASTLMGVISLLKTHSQADIQRVLRATASYFGCEEEVDV